MQTLESLKRTIRSAEDLGNVVRTMKTMAAVSIRQYEAAADSLKLYARTIETGLHMVLSRATQPGPHLQQTSDRTLGAIVFGSDQGMCGQFNEQIGQVTLEEMSGTLPDGQQARLAPILCVGHRVADTLSAAGLAIEQVLAVPGSAAGITWLVQDLLSAMDAWRNTHQVGTILVLHNKRLSASTWQPHRLQLLPLPAVPGQRTPRSLSEESESASTAGRSLPFWTMPTSQLISELVRQYLFVSLFQACAESLAGENASRIAAMQAAERNIKDRHHVLMSDYAQLRQTMITEELLDVVTGFEALRQSI